MNGRLLSVAFFLCALPGIARAGVVTDPVPVVNVWGIWMAGLVAVIAIRLDWVGRSCHWLRSAPGNRRMASVLLGKGRNGKNKQGDQS